MRAPYLDSFDGTTSRRLKTSGANFLITAAVGAVAQTALPWLSFYQRCIPAAPAATQLWLGAGGLCGLASGALLAASFLGLAVALRRQATGTVSGEPYSAVSALFWTTLSAVAQGLAIAPLVAQGAAVSLGPAGWITIGCVLGLVSVTTQAWVTQSAPTFSEITTALVLSAMVGPIGWDIHAGSLPIEAATRTLLAGSVMFICRSLLQMMWHLHLCCGSTAYLEPFVCDEEIIAQQRLDLGDPHAELAPTIFNVSDELREKVHCLQKKRGPLDSLFHGWCGVPVIALHGPPGQGKTAITGALGHSIRALMAPISAAELKMEDIDWAPIAGLNLLNLLGEAEIYAQKHGKPVVVFVDEVDAFLPTDKNDVKTQDGLNRALNLGLLLFALYLLNERTNHILVAFATNNVGDIQQALSLITTKAAFTVNPPSAQDMQKMLRHQLRTAQEKLNEMDITCSDLTSQNNDEAISKLSKRIETGGLSGRDLKALVNGSFSAVLATYGTRQIANEDYRSVFFEKLEGQLEDRLKSKRPPNPQPPSAAPQHKTASFMQPPHNLRSLLQALGLHQFEPEMIFQRLEAALEMSVADPQQSFILSQVTGRAARSAYQILINTWSTQISRHGAPQRDFDDVPRIFSSATS